VGERGDRTARVKVVNPDLLHGAMVARANAEVTMRVLDGGYLELSDGEWAAVELGIAAGIAAALLEAREAGMLRFPPDDPE
jgi:hypothetical protein